MKTPDSTKAESSDPSKRKFTGIDNPRQLRALAVLLRRPVSREELDHIAGCSSGRSSLTAPAITWRVNGVSRGTSVALTTQSAFWLRLEVRNDHQTT